MSERKRIPGKFVWFEHVSNKSHQVQEFYGEVLGWKVKPFPMGNSAYDMILTGESWDTMIGGYRPTKTGAESARWIGTVSVEDVDAAVKSALDNGGKVLDRPSDLPGVGRTARISDPQGAELALLTDSRGDKPDVDTPTGGWLWSELHTADPRSALLFYQEVVGFSHRSVDSAGGKYHVLASKDGVDRGGVTDHLPPGTAPHWLPYVKVEDVDASVARASIRGAAIPVGPMDIPGIGRIAVLEDPAGAVLAVMKPLPRQQTV